MNELNLPQIISIAAQLRESPPEALRTVLHSGPTLNLVLWQIPPGAALPPHHHPTGAGHFPRRRARRGGGHPRLHRH